jgi:hypothetical protein
MYSSDGFRFLSLDELHALVFRLDLAETIECLDEVRRHEDAITEDKEDAN